MLAPRKNDAATRGAIVQTSDEDDKDQADQQQPDAAGEQDVDMTAAVAGPGVRPVGCAGPEPAA